MSIFTIKKGNFKDKIFTAALGILSPWRIMGIEFNAESKRFDIDLSFRKGSRFEVDGDLCPVRDRVEKEWKLLNFF